MSPVTGAAKGPFKILTPKRRITVCSVRRGGLGNSFKEKSVYFCLNPPLWGILVLYLVLNPSFCM